MSLPPLSGTRSSVVLLDDYQDHLVRHIFDEDSGLVTEARFADEKARGSIMARRSVVGFGSWREVGLLRAKYRVFVAVYSTRENLVLRVGSVLFQWPDVSLRAQRANVFPGIKRFQVRQGKEPLFTVRYRYFDTETWPDNGDIFCYVERATLTPGEVARTIAFWTAHAAGRDILSQELADELDKVAHAVDSGYRS